MSIDPVSLAITVALTAANMAITASRTIEGPRISDTAATVADYGTPLNYLVGQRVLQCSCFFAKPIKEVKKKHKGKGGKQVTYSGIGTWAVCVADQEIAGIGKIWFDNHLVYDATGSGEKVYPLGEDNVLRELFQAKYGRANQLGDNMRLYLGTEDQDADHDMQAYIEARDGAGTCPAYRGVAYIYFQDIPLENLGNRFPDVKVLVRTAVPRKYDGWDYEIEVRNIFSEHKSDGGGASTNIVNWPNGASHSPSGDEIINTDPLVRRDIFHVKGHGSGSGYTGSGIGTWTAISDPVFAVNPGLGVSNKLRVEIWFRHWTQASATMVDFSDFSNYEGARDLSWDCAIGWDPSPRPEDYDAGNDTTATLEQLLELVSAKAGIDPADYDWSATADLQFGGYNWTQSSFKQALAPVLDLFDTDVRPHDFKLEALPRGSTSLGAIPTEEFVLPDAEDGTISPFTLPRGADSDLPRRVFLVYADLSADQNPNTAMPPGQDPDAVGSTREMSLDMQTMALTPDMAQQLVERRHRRERFGRVTSQFAVTRKRIAIEPGDVYTPSFYTNAITMRCTKLVIGADGKLDSEWERDHPQLGVLPVSPGAAAQGYIPDTVPDVTASVGAVLDIPLIADAHDQSAPLAYLVAGPAEPGTWIGADIAQSDTGDLDTYVDGWDGIAPSDGAVIGACAAALPAALPWVPDNGSSVSVTINAGELTSASLEDLLTDPTLNLAAIAAGDGWELVQFMTATLTDDLTYTLAGFLRGVRGTEWAIGGHAADDRFILLDTAAKLRTMGASELGDTDWYIIHASLLSPDPADAFSLAYTGASHKPYAAAHGSAVQSGGDWVFDAVRRTRIGGGSLDNQDVPLGEASESWSLDILDGGAVARTITGTSLPLTYDEADQVTDFGAAQSTISANLYQVDPTLSLRGYPLAIAA